LVALDLDRTLLRSDGSVSPASVQTLAQWTALGVAGYLDMLLR
jgi:hydroxymethylpyrimidine pyrophosphatase-like HAD family hydrolase